MQYIKQSNTPNQTLDRKELIRSLKFIMVHFFQIDNFEEVFV